MIDPVAKKGAIGMSATTVGLGISYMQQLEIAFRVLSLLVGLAIGIATFISILAKMKRDNRRFEYEQKWQNPPTNLPGPGEQT